METDLTSKPAACCVAIERAMTREPPTAGVRAKFSVSLRQRGGER
jgi:hypothetical protein